MSSVSPQTLTYSTTTKGHQIQLDLYLPLKTNKPVPALVFYHGGGLVSGDKRDTLWPNALKDKLLAEGIAVISANYRLLNPSTGFDIIEDIKALWFFISTSLSSTIDINRVAVGGGSGGGFVSYLAAIHASPKPKAVWLGYAAGGNLLTDYHLLPGPKGAQRFSAEEIQSNKLHLNSPRDVGALLGRKLEEESSVPLSFNGVFDDVKGRMGLWSYYWGNGTLVDVLTGSPGLSASLIQLPTVAEREAAIPVHLRPLFPQVLLDSSFPPVYFMHGGDDSIILLEESEYAYRTLQIAGVKSTLYVDEGAEHGLLEGAGSDVEKIQVLIVEFMKEYLRP